MRRTTTVCVPLGTPVMRYRPSSSVAAPSPDARIVTAAAATGVPDDWAGSAPETVPAIRAGDASVSVKGELSAPARSLANANDDCASDEEGVGDNTAAMIAAVRTDRVMDPPAHYV